MDTHFAVSLQSQTLPLNHWDKMAGSDEEWQEGVSVALTDNQSDHSDLLQHRIGLPHNVAGIEASLVISQLRMRPRIPAPLPHLNRFLRLDRGSQEHILDRHALTVWRRFTTWAKLNRMNPRGSYRRMRENAMRRWKRLQRLCDVIGYRPRIRPDAATLMRMARYR